MIATQGGSRVFIFNSLNPCFGGSWVMIVKYDGCVRRKRVCLNPCFGGSWVMMEKILFHRVFNARS